MPAAEPRRQLRVTRRRGSVPENGARGSSISTGNIFLLGNPLTHPLFGQSELGHATFEASLHKEDALPKQCVNLEPQDKGS